MMLQALHTTTHTHTHKQHKRFQISSSLSPEKLIIDTLCHKLDVIKADCRKGTQLELSMESNSSSDDKNKKIMKFELITVW